MPYGLHVPIPTDDGARVADLARLGILLAKPDAVLESFAQELARVFDMPSAAISFLDSDTQYYMAAVGIPEPFATTRVEPRDMSICSFVVGNNDTLVVEDLAADRRFCESIAVTDFGLRFYAGAPLRAESGRAIGSLCILDQRPRSISQREREMLRLVAEGVMSHVMLQAASQQLFTYTTKIEADLKRAANVQRFLLPPAHLERPGWEIRHLYRPMTHLGGDFIDVATRPDDRTAVLVADVAGHGTDAALMSAMIKTSFGRAAARSGCATDILDGMNRELVGAAPPGQFVSAVVAVLDERSGNVEISCAGHPPPIIDTASGAAPVTCDNNMLLAIDADARFDERTNLVLEHDDRLLFYTDGAFEGRSSADPADQLGLDGLSRIVHSVKSTEEAAFLPRILQRIDGHSRGQIQDDVALVSVRRSAAAASNVPG